MGAAGARHAKAKQHREGNIARHARSKKKRQLPSFARHGNAQEKDQRKCDQPAKEGPEDGDGPDRQFIDRKLGSHRARAPDDDGGKCCEKHAPRHRTKLVFAGDRLTKWLAAPTLPIPCFAQGSLTDAR